MRDALRQDFIAASGWGDATVIPFAADASRRRYFRLQRADGETRLVMDMPPHPEERFTEFVMIDKYMLGLGLSVPKIHALDDVNQFALIEDFGDDTYTRLLNAGRDPVRLYNTAIDAAAYLQKHANQQAMPLKHYDAAAMADEMGWFVEWYMPLYMQRPVTDQERHGFYAIVNNIFMTLPQLEPTLLLRDFHVDNFMWLDKRDGIAACGILDFQDAKWGSPAYDLVSILEDARRDLDPGLARDLYKRYLGLRFDLAPELFAIHYAAMGILRHARVLGFLARIWLRDSKPHYIQQFLPRVQNQLAGQLNHPTTKVFATWLNNSIPHWHQPLAAVDQTTARGWIKPQLLIR